MQIGSTTKAPASMGEREQLRSWMEAEGERAVVAAMSLSRMGIYRILSGLPVTAGTRALLRVALECREVM